jgi:hypothetical protein
MLPLLHPHWSAVPACFLFFTLIGQQYPPASSFAPASVSSTRLLPLLHPYWSAVPACFLFFTLIGQQYNKGISLQLLAPAAPLQLQV